MYRKNVLAVGSALSFGVVALLGILILHAGTAYAVPLAGVGGFTVQADEIRGYGAHIYVGVGDGGTSGTDQLSVTEFQRSEIEGLTIVKPLDVDAFPGLGGSARVVVSTTDTVTTGGQVMRTTSIRADRATLREQAVDESPAPGPIEQFSIAVGASRGDGRAGDERPDLVLENATIDAHHFATDHVTFSGESVRIEYDSDGDGTYERTFGN